MRGWLVCEWRVGERGEGDRHGGFRAFFDNFVLDHDFTFCRLLVPSRPLVTVSLSADC